MFKHLKHIIFSILLFFSGGLAYSQSIYSGSLLDEQLQLQSLLNDSLQLSTINKPFSNKSYTEFSELSILDKSKWWNNPVNARDLYSNSVLSAKLLPIFIQNTSNSRLPISENNRAAWYGRGSNLEFTGGFLFNTKYLTLNIQPQIVYQENVDFLHPRFIRFDSDGNVLYRAQEIGLRLDNPFRFGPDPFTTVDWGNSSIRIRYSNFQAGISTEPLWWGPAGKYPLMMSNNAPGFAHGFIGTKKPVLIPKIGFIQFRWISGYPKQSKYYDGVGRNETRFTNGANIAFSPMILKNMTIGLSRVFHLYEVDGFNFRNVLGLFDPFSRAALVRTQGGDSVRQVRNQTASLYVHLKFAEARAEIFAEMFREDHSYDMRDFFIQPHHNSAFSFGFQKISDFPKVDFIKTHLEFTNLTASQLDQVRFQSYYYTHSRIRQGHTNRGQLLGAAIGPGSNSQFLSIDAYKGIYKFGIYGQRIVRNDNFHFKEGSSSISPSRDFGDYFRHRIDLNFGLNFLYGPGPFYINSRLVWTKAYNYGRFDYGNLDGVNAINYDQFDRTNVQFQIGITIIP